MKTRRMLHVLTASLLAIILMLTGCGTTPPAATATASPAPSVAAATDEPAASAEATAVATEVAPSTGSAYGKYDPPIELTMIRSVDSTRSYMDGETWDNNLWTKAYEEKLGIKFKYTWTTLPEEYDNKVNLAIASNDLPDYFRCSYDQFYRLASAGKLADLTGAVDTMGSPALKAAYAANNGLLTKQTTIDGKILALGEVSDLTGAGHMLWYRDDWAKKLGLAEPKTQEDLWNMAKLFAKEDPNGTGVPTVGFGVDKGLWNSGTGLEGWFAMDGAYPTIWVDNGGKLVFGATQDAAKITLQKLQDAYKDGLIDQDFINKGPWAEFPDDIVKNKVGMVIGPIWFGDWKCKDVMQAKGDKSATWTSMPVPGTKTSFSAKLSSVYVMNISAKNPEAAVKISNLTGELMNGKTAEGKYHDQKDAAGNNVDNFFHTLGFGYNEIIAWNLYCAKQVTAAIESGSTANLNDEQKSYYDRCMSFINWKPGDPTDGLLGYTSYSIFAGPKGSQFVGEKMDKEGLQLMDAYYGPNTDAMNENWGNLMSKRDEIFTSIIMGTRVEDGFKQWKDFWTTMKGDLITQEVNDWAAKNK